MTNQDGPAQSDDQGEGSGDRWPRDIWIDAMWNNDALKPNERVVAYAYYRYAGSKRTTWCAWNELRARTGIKSRDALNRAIKGLIDGGWLREAKSARQHYSAIYRMTIPAQQSVSRTPDESQGSISRTSGDAQESGNRTAEPNQEYATRTPEPETVPDPDTPAVRFPAPAVRFATPSSPFRGPYDSDNDSDNDSEGGHAAPQTPRRTPTPSGPGTEELNSPSVGGTDQLNPQSNHPHARVHVAACARREPPTGPGPGSGAPLAPVIPITRRLDAPSRLAHLDRISTVHSGDDDMDTAHDEPSFPGMDTAILSGYDEDAARRALIENSGLTPDEARAAVKATRAELAGSDREPEP